MKLFSNFKVVCIKLNRNMMSNKPIYNISIGFNSIIYIVEVKIIYYNININHLFIILHILYRLNLTHKYGLSKKKDIIHFAQLLKANMVT